MLLSQFTDNIEPFARLKDFHKVTGWQEGELEFSLKAELRTRFLGLTCDCFQE